MSISNRLSQKLSKCPENQAYPNEWRRANYPDAKISPKGISSSNYRPIMCLPMVCKIKHSRMDDEGENYIDVEISPKGTIISKWRPITCLPMVCKILTTHIKEELYNSLESYTLFPGEQKGCCMGTRGTDNIQYTDQHIIQEVKTRYSIDCRQKANNVFLKTWIIEYLKMFKISNNHKLYLKNHEKFIMATEMV